MTTTLNRLTPFTGTRLAARTRWAAACLLAVGLVASSVSQAAPPNVVLCMGDDHGWEETGYNGHPFVQTPVLDEMAAGGLRFDRFYAAHPSCSPTRGSVMTGRHPNRYGTFAPNWSIRPEEITIAQLLAEAGYQCGHFGKWHLGPVKADSPTSPGAMGFDQWLSHDNFFELDPTLSRNGASPEVFAGESSEIIVDAAVDFIRSAKQNDAPFFVVIWFGSPHEPYSGLERDLAIYDSLPKRYADQQVQLTSNETGRSVRRPLGEVLRERYAEITAMDRAIGKLRRALREQNVHQNTMLWYCGDNGTPASGQLATPLRGQKSQMYEGGIRVPGVLEWPQRLSKPAVTQVGAVTSDLLPTLCAAAGIPLPARPLDGIDLTPVIEGTLRERSEPICFWSFPTGQVAKDARPWIDSEAQEGTTPLIKLMNGKPTRSFKNFHHPVIVEEDFGGARAICNQRYKLLLEASGEQPRELYDLIEDPAESRNLIETHPEVAKDLEKQLHTWQQSVLESLTGKDY